MPTTSEDAAALVADVHDLIDLVQLPEIGSERRTVSDRPGWGRCRVDWLPFGHEELMLLIGLGESVAAGAEAVGLGNILKSIGPGYGPDNLPLPMCELTDEGDGGGAVFLPSKFPAWRNAMSALLNATLDLKPELEGESDEPVEEATEPDGPSDRFQFRWRGKTVDFSKANLRFKLVDALWDRSRGAPHKSREITDVMEDVYPGDDKADAKFKNLCAKVRGDFERAGLALTVTTANGTIWLQSSPN